jgi:hypothetical protein
MVRTRINRLNVRRNRTVVFCPFQTKNHSEWLGFQIKIEWLSNQ